MYDTTTLLFFIFTAVLFFALFLVSAVLHTARKERKLFEAQVCTSRDCWILYKKVHAFFFHDVSFESMLFCLSCAQQILRVCTVIFSSALYLGSFSLSQYLECYAWVNFFETLQCFIFFFVLIATFILTSDLLPRLWAVNAPLSLLSLLKNPTAFFLFLLSPLIAIFYHLIRLALPQSTFTSLTERKKQLVDLIDDIADEKAMSEHDRRLFTSVLNFRNRIAREIMKPRVELFCLSDTTTVEDAAAQLLQEGYSRVPIYHGSVDSITGILFFKDLLAIYMQNKQAPSDSTQKNTPLQLPVTALSKKVLYCPETKKISSLLQEFRKKQLHLAIVVDEYGGTSGIVTIEDILEEIVGEIADEYDDDEALIRPANTASGGWIINAQMNILDVQEELGIEIPQDDDYDTLAGYIFYRLGNIPQSGIVLHHDHFEMKILKSNDRTVEEVLLVANNSEKLHQ